MAKCCGQESYGQNQRPQNDRRHHLIDSIKQLLQDTENKERSRGAGHDAQRGCGRGVPGVRNMDEECLQYRKRRECSPPIITSLGAHEIRPTSMYDQMKYSNTKQVTYVDATRSTDPYDPMPPAPWELPRTPSQELRAGNLYTSCGCLKRNGLQHDCQRWECGGRPECVAVNPGPCCVPSKARKPVRGDRRHYKSGAGAGDPGKQQGADQKGGQHNPVTMKAKEPAMLCMCAPVDMGPPRRPQAPPQQRQQPGPVMDFVGVCAVTSPPGSQQQEGCCVAMSPAGSQSQSQERALGPKGVGMVCLCQPAQGYQSPSPVYPPQPQYQPRPQGGEFGAKYLCCPL